LGWISGESVNALRPTLEQALRHHQAGRLAEAEALYRAVLRRHPGQPDAFKLMEDWRRVPAVPIHEVVYEELVAQPEAGSRALESFCGLDWDERCLSFYRTEPVVQTSGKLQVRQPIYHRSIGRWAPFQVHLDPLRRALGITQRSRPGQPDSHPVEDCHAE
jgi:hypothetical protein